MRIDHSLYLVSERAQDAALDSIAQRFGFKRIGSGFGFGARDLEYRRDDALSSEQIMELRKELAPFKLLCARYAVENWNEEWCANNDAELEEHDLLAA